MASKTIVEAARAWGDLAPGCWRVMVIESDARISHQDFTDLDEARMYADDAASETDDQPPLAYVFDNDFEMVYEGRPYLA